ncbi:MAG TPA: carboxypeptidase regulatory-like domain-containing protein [Geobacteraceae bacterium]
MMMLASPASAAVVEGIILSDQGPVTQGMVEAYAQMQDIDHLPPSAVSTAGDKPGFYRLELPEGSYYLVAKGAEDGRPLWSFHGANPVTVKAYGLWLPFAVTERSAPEMSPANGAIVSGMVSYRGEPVAGAQVSLYAAAEGAFRGFGLQSRETSSDGTFRFEVVPGDYVLVGRKRLSAQTVKPLAKGDLFCYYGGNPVVVADNQNTFLRIACYPKDDIAGYLQNPQGVKRSNSDLVRLREKSHAGPTTIRGRVIDLTGKPCAGMQVTAYRAEPGQLFQMQLLRLKGAYQTTTDSSGSYSLPVEQTGSYYLVARERGGESPVKGEYYGLYEGDVDHTLAVDGSRKELNDVRLVVSRVMADCSYTPHAIQSKRPSAKVTRLNDAVIDRDTTWSGTVIISGRVVVARRATLTIAPGATIKFVRVDRDGDGVGDGELRVLGRLLAKGTSLKPIRFRSAARKPTPGDWSYLLIFTSGADNIIEHCRFENAFTGLQVHFSRAMVRDSLFLNNREGIRFGRAEMNIEHNDFHGNGFGIRHHRLEGPVSIMNNNFYDNEVGIFLVPSGQNIMNFSPETYRIAGDQDHFPVVRGNNFHNLFYDYKLGERQSYDVILPGNWWGAAAEERIYAKIFDSGRDASLGKVRITPIRLTPVPGAGIRKGG